MIEQTVYKCAFCGQTTLDRDSCIACEKSHISPLYIEESTWCVGVKGYPYFIDIHMADSTIVRYKYKDIVMGKGKHNDRENRLRVDRG